MGPLEARAVSVRAQVQVFRLVQAKHLDFNGSSPGSLRHLQQEAHVNQVQPLKRAGGGGEVKETLGEDAGKWSREIMRARVGSREREGAGNARTHAPPASRPGLSLIKTLVDGRILTMSIEYFQKKEVGDVASWKAVRVFHLRLRSVEAAG